MWHVAGIAIYHSLIIALWLVLVLYWAVSAGAAKRNIGGTWGWRRQVGVRLGVLILVVLALRITPLSHALRDARVFAVNRSMVLGFVGVALCALGVVLAITARVYLGRNWGMPMSQKEDPELVTTGPYAFVRHPIYTGIFLAMLGSTIGLSIFWLLPLFLVGGYFIHCARQEEKLLLAQFPERYPAYKRRTKMFLPFVL